MGVESRGGMPPWIFIHGTNIVNRGLKVLFFSVILLFFQSFFRCPPPSLKEANIAIFGVFLLFFDLPTPLNTIAIGDRMFLGMQDFDFAQI